MKINKLRWKNFTSWGNSWQEMNFDKAPGVSLISGKNGAGKSSISNAIIYMLYGQLDGFAQKDIPNHINKHFEGEIFFTTNEHVVYIYRALSPNGFKVTIDGESIDTAGKNNIQKWLEEEIYKIPYDIFKNSIVLSVDDFKSFVDLSPKEKRDIIDRMFGYHIINVASSKVKDKLKSIRSEINLKETSIQGYNSSISEISSNISKINSESEDISETVSLFENIKEKMKQDVVDYKSRVSDIQTLETKLNSVSSRLQELNYESKEIQSKLKLYENGICPTCGTSLSTESHRYFKSELLNRQSKITEDHNTNKKKYEELNKEYNEICLKKAALMDRINDMKVEYAKYETIINEHGKSKESQIANLESMKSSIEIKMEPQREELVKLEKQNKLLNIVSDIFSENGLKQYISNIYIPLINDYVNEACTNLCIPYRVVFTTGYDCEISFMGDMVKYKTLSRGERKKVDIAVTLAFLKIIKTKISDINLLFLDEVLSGIDVASCNDLLKIFSDFSKDTELRIYMVHHANLDSTWVDENIEIEKQSGFSHFMKCL